jgi:predicted enzyme related to lactoylglutathione lyase
MGSVQIEQKSYEMPPKDGMSIAHFLTVKDIERSARYYEKVFGARILSLGDGNAPGYLQLANIWMIVNVGGGPTVDKPTVSLSVPDPNHISSFLNFGSQIFRHAMSYGKVEEPSSSRSRWPNTARSAATSAILTATSLRLVKAQILRTVDAWPSAHPSRFNANLRRTSRT